MSIQVQGQAVRLELSDWKALVGGGSLPPEVADIAGFPEALQAVQAPMVKMTIALAEPELRDIHLASIDYQMAALLLHVGGPQYQLMALPPTFIAGALAKLIPLRPLPNPEGRFPRPVHADLIDAVFASGAEDRGAACSQLGLTSAWRVEAATSARKTSVAGVTDPRGHWLIDSTDRGAALNPVNATTVWQRLSDLLPSIATTTAATPAT